MNDVPLDNAAVAGVMIQCLKECDRAFNAALIETRSMMPSEDWNVLRRGVGQILGSDMFDLWSAIVKKHPQFENDFVGGSGENGGGHRS
ncbi:MAG: hypothetical protein U0987_07445 [Afipia sp.]|nr:hypothetical protein [Afipia sp.]